MRKERLFEAGNLHQEVTLLGMGVVTSGRE